ncbi:hypothetical protein KKF84_04280 [Myxococcota bacterium]|nr:hypothetical protein [Myxococcota bacterium]
MSLIYSIKKLVDPNAARIEEAHAILMQRAQPRTDDSDDLRYRCRVCGFVSKSREYCPSCLADTMEEYQIIIY